MDTQAWVLTTLLLVLGSARITRLLVIDKLPPIQKARDWYENKMDGTGWELLTMCGYCMSFWVVSGNALVAYLLGVFDNPYDLTWGGVVWGVINAVFALAYVTAIVVAYDGDKDEN